MFVVLNVIYSTCISQYWLEFTRSLSLCWKSFCWPLPPSTWLHYIIVLAQVTNICNRNTADSLLYAFPSVCFWWKNKKSSGWPKAENQWWTPSWVIRIKRQVPPPSSGVTPSTCRPATAVPTPPSSLWAARCALGQRSAINHRDKEPHCSVCGETRPEQTRRRRLRLDKHNRLKAAFIWKCCVFFFFPSPCVCERERAKERESERGRQETSPSSACAMFGQ